MDIDPAALALRDSASAELIATLQAEAEAAGGPAPDAVAAHARELFDKYFAVSQQRKEPPAQAAAKIAKLVARQTRKALGFDELAEAAAQAPEPAPEAAEAPPEASGTVTGKTAGIERKLMNVLNAVSAHFGQPIDIVSGQRNRNQQLSEMFANWQSHLRNGRDNAYLAANEKLRLELEALKQAKDRKTFIEVLGRKADLDKLSRHMSGDEVDLAANTDPAIVEALASCLNHRQGRNSEGKRVHHFDNSRVVWPIPESTRARWKS
ncbi:hypothetical protein [Seohaeicola zhoushanensis]|uniref:Uncharacterized protein n=1 Tax=Seohaeicola zhoushanensis TaxID=1569283 RepID=A0A8J3H3N9_9RHOB|nr:hypothetical protein [Seohaeicola zhoushanensis]GHF72820.1 hypothetical protein GCM10017056_49600 [Seohaeicola zhoushanensis]